MSLNEAPQPTDGSPKPVVEFGEPDLHLNGVIDRLNLEKAIDHLPYGYKKMLILHDIEGYQHNEISRILGCSVGNSKSQLHKARQRLRELLPRRFAILELMNTGLFRPTPLHPQLTHGPSRSFEEDDMDYFRKLMLIVCAALAHAHNRSMTTFLNKRIMKRTAFIVFGLVGGLGGAPTFGGSARASP